MTPPPPFRRRKLGLQFKLTIATLVMVMTPLGVSAYLISGIGKITANFNQKVEEEAHQVVRDESARIYDELVKTTKRLYGEMAERLAKRPDLLALDPAADLGALIKDPQQASLRAIATLRADGSVVAQAERPASGAGWREVVVDEPLGSTGAVARLTFEVPEQGAELDRLEKALDLERPALQMRTALPQGYQTAFLVLMTLAAVAAASFGVLASTFVTRRIAALVTAARAVSDGRHDTRVELRGGDEMAELGGAFNTMLDDLAQTRSQIEYLQRIGAWQDVARRLAHEIKNPLTPIQLAVQQCVSAYKGDDEKFKKLLAETGEIVEEEIEGLRRLVDTFRTLGQLPKVEKAPLLLGDVLEELKLDPAISDRLVLRPPARPVTVRADKLLLKRVLANLIENGIHAGEEAGAKPEVVVGWSSDPNNDTVSITIDDRGPGVPDAERDRIFEPYVTTKSTGTGLGLAIARKIAIEHGGELALAPGNAPTGGARFVVSLPLRGPDTSLG